MEKEKFIKAFNAGYQLSKHEPELLDSILKSSKEDGEYLKAIRLGKKQHDREKALLKIQQAQLQKGNEKERD